MLVRWTVLLVLLVHCGLSAIVTKCCNQRKAAGESQPCISYDSSVMAESLDEAMFTFPNLASNDQSTLFKAPGGFGGGGGVDQAQDRQGDDDSDEEHPLQASASGPSVMTTKVSIAAFGSGTPLASSELVLFSIVIGIQEMAANGECPTYACMSCKMSLINGFLANPNLGAADNATLTAQRNELALRLGTTEGSCSQGTRKKRTEGSANESTRQKQVKKRLAKRFVLMNTTPDPLNDEGIDDNTIDSSTTSSDNNANTGNQNQSTKNRTTLGVVTNLGCQYRRGEALETNSAWCGLCNLCWQWRKLPSDYYPNYLNEVNCDFNDDGCLSGFGECKPIMRSINVMRKLGEEWVKESIDTTSGCECQVEIGSSLHGLVVK